eukprot:Polyplicarium_translucidae@DN2977_c0_g2_i1.p2
MRAIPEDCDDGRDAAGRRGATAASTATNGGGGGRGRGFNFGGRHPPSHSPRVLLSPPPRRHAGLFRAFEEDTAASPSTTESSIDSSCGRRTSNSFRRTFWDFADARNRQQSEMEPRLASSFSRRSPPDGVEDRGWLLRVRAQQEQRPSGPFKILGPPFRAATDMQLRDLDGSASADGGEAEDEALEETGQDVSEDEDRHGDTSTLLLAS